MSSFVLKIIAMVTMFIDHFAYVFLPTDSQLYQLCRIIGRTAFPIYCFLIVEGFFFTRDIKKYFLRLTILAFVSEIPFDLMNNRHSFFNLAGQNVVFTLLIGLALVIVIDRMRQTLLYSAPFAYNTLAVLLILSAAFLAHFALTDYGAFGVLLILSMYFFREKRWVSLVMFVVLWWIFIGDMVTNFVLWQVGLPPIRAEIGMVEIYGLAAFLPIFLYNRKKGPDDRHLLYLFYPLHMLILALVAMLTGI